MLFNSAGFVFVFLPIVFAGFAVLRRLDHPGLVILWLVIASYLFYGWLDFQVTLLLAGSTIVNYAMGAGILQSRRSARDRTARSLMWVAVVFNLSLLGYFKYANFLVANMEVVTGAPLVIPQIALPVGISFYTFTQIAYIVDAAHGAVDSTHPLQYALFVSYFPHLVAGPILHHKSTIPQFRNLAAGAIDRLLVAAGLSIFALGLAKKVLVADQLAPLADAVFNNPGARSIGVMEGWSGALAYTFQIYFDFSGYSDMAVGLSLLFGIRLPLNFDSPYKATSIVEFWQRWHISLSQFLRDYLYIPLGGNRRGPIRRYLNIMITMLLGGLWHGASWTFVAWGGLHGIYLVVNHILRNMFPPRRDHTVSRLWLHWTKRAVVFILVVVSWVFFKADSFGSAATLLKAMFGANGMGQMSQPWVATSWLVASLVIVWFMPNSYEIFSWVRPTLPVTTKPVDQGRFTFSWRPTQGWAVVAACTLSAGILSVSKFSPFLYFRF